MMSGAGTEWTRDGTYLDPPDFMVLCRIARALFNAQAACMRLAGSPSPWIDLAPEASPQSWAFAGQEGAAEWERTSDRDGPPAATVRWIEDAAADPATAGWPHVAGAPGVRFLASLPFGPKGEGRLTLFDTRPRPATADQMARLQDLAATAGEILALHAAIRATAAREAGFRLLAETTTDTIVRGNLDGIRLYISPSVKTLLGYEPNELIGRRAAELVHPDDVADFAALMQQVREGRLELGISEQRQRHKNGSWVWLEAFVRLTYDDSGTPDGYVASARGIDRRKELEARLERLASYDDLTGLPNRLQFRQQLHAAVERTRRTGAPFALLYMDIDHFKQVNDSLGHRAGDAVLREVGARFRAIVVAEDAVTRLGGDEFAVIHPLEHGQEEAAALAARLIAGVARPFDFEGMEIAIGLSVGIARAPEDAVNADDLLSCADRALYRAKLDGRNAFRFHEATARA